MNESDLASRFDDFALSPGIQEGVKTAGFRLPSPIQAMAIPPALEGKDLIGQAHTGTGKTAAFGLPLMSRLEMSGGVEIIVITPTRELAGQVSDELYRLGQHAGVRTVTVYGGQGYARQIKMVNGGAQVLVATPGRMLDLLQGGKLKDFQPSMVVLDEADEMLDMGFLEDVKAIFEFLPDERQTLMFSATMPKPIRRLAESILNNPVHLQAIDDSGATNQDISQRYCVIEEREREDALIRLIEEQAPEKSMVFCRTRMECDELTSVLSARGYAAKALHGDMEQPARNKVMGGFKRGDFDLLIATDVASRGLDVEDVTHVFNFHIPFNSKSYIHRIGRTGRAGRKGIAITLATPREYRQIERIQQHTGTSMEATQVPRLSQLRKSRIARLQEQLTHVKLVPESLELIKSFEEDMAPEELCMRLVSLMLSEQQESGPDQIGLSPEDVNRLGRPVKRERKYHGRKPRYNDRGPRSGGKGGGRHRGGYKKPQGKRGPDRSR